MSRKCHQKSTIDRLFTLLKNTFPSFLQLTPEFSHRLTNKIRELLQQMERGLKSADPQDGTGYTGWAGMVLADMACTLRRTSAGPPQV